MWLKKLLAVSWLCALWTKVDAAVTDDATTPSWSAKGSLPPVKRNDERGDELRFEKVETTKTYSADSTVRSFFPVRGKQKWMRKGYPPAEEMLFFNVSIVSDNEEVSLAELHLHRRRIAKIHGTYHKRYLPLPYRVALYQVQPMYKRKVNRDARTMKLASIPVSYTTKSGWHTLDVTAVLRELLINAQGPVELLLGVQFEAPKRLPKTYSPLVPLKHFLKPTDTFGPDHSYRTSSYLVVFSEIDPYFEEVEEEEDEDEDEKGEEGTDVDEGDNLEETDNDIPDGHVFRERHLKHKISRVKSTDVEEEKESKKNKKDKIKKYKTMENEVYKPDYGRRKEEDVVRHKSKHRMTDVKRSKADELALQAKNKLKSLPFLHTNEVEEIRQTSRRLTRSVSEGTGNGIPLNPESGPTRDDIKRIIINHIKEVEDSVRRNKTKEEMCAKRELTVRLSDVDLDVKLAGPAYFVTAHCSGSCSSGGVTPRRCKPVSGKAIDFAYYDSTGEMVSVRLDNILATECECR